MSDIPADVMKTAWDHFQKTFFSQDIDTTTCIALAILAERERCAKVADYYGEASVYSEGTDDARGAAYYTCGDVSREIRHPKPAPEKAPDYGDDLPF